MSRLLITAGVVLVVLGLCWHLFPKMGSLGRLPGDIFVQKKNFTFYFPLTTSILLSIFLSLIIYLFSKR